MKPSLSPTVSKCGGWNALGILSVQRAICQVYGRRAHSSTQPYSAQKNSEYSIPLMFIVPRLRNCIVKNHLCKKMFVVLNFCGSFDLKIFFNG